MKSYADLYAESPRALMRKLEDDIKALETRLARLDRLAVDGVAGLLAEYERLSTLVEQGAYGMELQTQWRWTAMDGPAHIANLYAPEQLDDGRWFCWSGPDAATTFVLPVLRQQPLSLRVHFMKTLEPEMLRSVALTVDGQRVRHQATDSLLVAEIAPRPRSSAAATLLTLDTLTTASPGGDDGRKLGIALFAIDVEPVGTIGTPSSEEASRA